MEITICTDEETLGTDVERTLCTDVERTLCTDVERTVCTDEETLCTDVGRTLCTDVERTVCTDEETFMDRCRENFLYRWGDFYGTMDRWGELYGPFQTTAYLALQYKNRLQTTLSWCSIQDDLTFDSRGGRGGVFVMISFRPLGRLVHREHQR